MTGRQREWQTQGGKIIAFEFCVFVSRDNRTKPWQKERRPRAKQTLFESASANINSLMGFSWVTSHSVTTTKPRWATRKQKSASCRDTRWHLTRTHGLGRLRVDPRSSRPNNYSAVSHSSSRLRNAEKQESDVKRVSRTSSGFKNRWRSVGEDKRLKRFPFR